MAKCQFHTTSTEYLGYLVTPGGITIDPARVKTIQQWPEPTSVHEIRVFIGFLNYYRRFIKKFGGIAAPLNELTKKDPADVRKGHQLWKKENQKIDIGEAAREAFYQLRNSFLEIPILAHWEPDRPTRVETDASGIAISGILSQLETGTASKGQWRPVAFYSKKMTDTEMRYDTHDGKLLAIQESLMVWRHYLEGLKDSFKVITDHANLRYFMKTKTLSRRQTRWAERLGAEDVVRATSAGLRYLQRQLTSDGDLLAQNSPVQSSLATVQTRVRHGSDALEELQMSRTFVEGTEERLKVLQQCHADPLSGHFGYRRTLEKIQRHYTWPGLRKDLQEYIGACLVCKRAKAVRHAPYGYLQALPVPDNAWES
jgi:hypothetical protein